jgi:anthranilate phosphoribosyltransferase
MKESIRTLIEGRDLSREETSRVFDIIMAGEATAAQIAGFAVALRMKGETAEEIAGAASSMRRQAVFIDAGGLPVVDTCGTGGDAADTFNVSTAAALVTAGAGVPVAKHGNRAVSSRCGSADVLEALGVAVDAPPDLVETCIREVGIGFLFAPRLHPAMRHAGPARREIGVRTVFNMLGPLTNPAGAKGQLLGVFAPEWTETLAEVLKRLGCRRAFVVHGLDGMDEITTTTTTRVSELRDGAVQTYELDPLRYVPDGGDPESLRGGDPAYNAAIIRSILAGEPGPCRDIVCLNAAAAITAGGKADDLFQGMKLAAESIDSGRALAVLNGLIACTNGLPAGEAPGNREGRG